MADISEALEPPAEVETDVDEAGESEEGRAKKKAKRAPLHRNYWAPLSFLEDAVKAAQKDDPFNMTTVGKPFGLSKEAYARPCYEEIVDLIAAQLPTGTITKDEKKMKLFIIRGSSGIGKSTFLAYFVVRFRGYYGKTILCRALKSAMSNDNDSVICQVWDKGTKLLDGYFRFVQKELKEHMSTSTLIVLDGCSLPLDLADFRGTMIMAAPPSLYVNNLEGAVIITNRKSFTMPALSENEALAIAAMIGVEGDVVKYNFCYMGGIARYLFEPGAAKLKVEEAAAQGDASAITRMVSMQSTSNAAESA